MKHITILALFLSARLFATDYYFSSVNGDDINNGTTALTPKSSMASLQTVLNDLNPGDNIYLERGSVWYEVDLDIISQVGTLANPIRITTYGTGALPILSGEIELSSPTKAGNVYTFTDTDIPDVYLTKQSYGRRYLGSVTIDGRAYATSRYPNTTYLYCSSSNRSSITDDEGWSTNYWADGWIAVKIFNWVFSSARVISNTSTALTTTNHITRTFGDTASWRPTGAHYYYFLNAEHALDLNGEWFWDDGVLKVYWEGALGTVKVSKSDTIINILNSDYIYLDSLDLRGANFFGIKSRASDYVKINACKIGLIGQMGVYVYGQYGGGAEKCTGTEVTNNEFYDCLNNSVTVKYAGGTKVTGNYVHRNAMNNGYFNFAEDYAYIDNEGYAITIDNNQTSTAIVNRNFIDSTCFGIKNHDNDGNSTFRTNFVRDYGMSERADGGAFYAVSDPNSSTLKLVRSNFFLNAHSPSGTIPADEWGNGRYSDEFTHAVYLDQDTYNFKADSNSIENAACALFTNGGMRRSFKRNKIRYPNTQSMYPSHEDAVHHSYAIPLTASGSISGYDTIRNNSYILYDVTSHAYSFWRKATGYGCGFPLYSYNDYEKYFDPFSKSADVAKEVNTDNYAITGDYNITEWRNKTYDCTGGPYDPGNLSTYDNTAYIATRMFKNWDNDAHTFTLTATYDTEAGVSAGSSISVPAFSSTLLFARAGTVTDDIDINIDSTLAPFLSTGLSYTEPEDTTTVMDTIWFEDANTLFKAEVDASDDCSENAVIYKTAFVAGGDATTDTIGYLNFTYYQETAAPFVYVSSINKEDSVLLHPDIYFINTPKLDGGGQGTDGDTWPFNINYYEHFFNTDSVVYTIRGAGLDAANLYSVGVLSSALSATTRYLYMYIGSETASVNAAANDNNTATIDSITPVDNAIEIVFKRTSGLAGYINALFLIETTPGTMVNDTNQAYVKFSNVQFGTTQYDSLYIGIDHGLVATDTSCYITLDSLDGDTLVMVTSPGTGCQTQFLILNDTISGTHDLYVTVDSLDTYVWMLFDEYVAPIITGSRTPLRSGAAQKILRGVTPYLFIRILGGEIVYLYGDILFDEQYALNLINNSYKR